MAVCLIMIVLPNSTSVYNEYMVHGTPCLEYTSSRIVCNIAAEESIKRIIKKLM